jgi:hypothetical protein
MYGNVLRMLVLPLHLLWKMVVYLPSIAHVPSWVPTYFFRRVWSLMLNLQAEYAVFHIHTITYQFVGVRFCVDPPRNEACKTWHLRSIDRLVGKWKYGYAMTSHLTLFSACVSIILVVNWVNKEEFLRSSSWFKGHFAIFLNQVM